MTPVEAGAPESPVWALLSEIEAAINGGAWILALMGLVAVPDICAALQSEDARTTSSRYKAWFEAYLGAEYPEVDPAEMWQIRNSMLHTGTTAGRPTGYSRIVFPAPSPNTYDRNVLDDALQLDLPLFYERTTAAVRAWRAGVGDTERTRKNEKRMIQWYRGGRGPYLVGLDVLT